jgi:long-chain acyl-CoA synthetase
MGGSLTCANLVKLQGDKSIALECLDSTCESCNLVSNLYVHADPIVIIVPCEAYFHMALSDEPPHTPLATVRARPKVAALMLRERNVAGKKPGFKGIEIL